MVLCLRWATTPRLTRATLHPQCAPHLLHVSRVDGLGRAECTLPLGGLVLQDMALPGVLPDQLPVPRDADTVTEALARLQLRHFVKPPCVAVLRREPRQRAPGPLAAVGAEACAAAPGS